MTYIVNPPRMQAISLTETVATIANAISTARTWLESIAAVSGSTQMHMLSERHLRDIGLTRADIAAAARALPSHAASDLDGLRADRTCNW